MARSIPRSAPLEKSSLARKIRTCKLCALSSQCQGPVPGEGPQDAKIVFLARNPGATEDLENRPLVGKSGAGPFGELLKRLGFQREQVGLVNTVSCFTATPTPNRPPSDEEIAACRPNLEAQLRFFSEKKLLVAMGNEALRAVLPEEKRTITHEQIEGVFLDGGNSKSPGKTASMVLPLRHPAAFLRDRAAALRFGRIRLPSIVQRVRQICGT